MLVTFNELGRWGRLGNQLFQIAATIGEARRRGWNYAFNQWDYASYFAGPFPELPTWSDHLAAYREPSFTWRETSFPVSTQLVGYFQSERYFAHCATEVRQLLAVQPWITEQCKEQCSQLFDSPTCSLHVRRGDYVNHPFLVDLAATEYYERAMNEFASGTRFVVFSDDIDWCRERFRGRQFVFVKSNHEVVDLYLMSRFSAHIIANSSFSWWGAWLSGQAPTVIAPRLWFQGVAADPRQRFVPGPPHRGFHDTCDLVPAAWRRV